jgi:hypothetical protein
LASGDKPIIDQRYEASKNRAGATGAAYTGDLQLSSE